MNKRKFLSLNCRGIPFIVILAASCIALPCAMLFIPYIRNILIKLAESILGRTLNHEHWHNVLPFLAQQGLIIVISILVSYSVIKLCIKKKIVTTQKIDGIFTLAIISFLLFTAMLCFLTDGKVLIYFLHQDITDSFMDLFNSTFTMSCSQRMGNYPPLACLSYLWLNTLIPSGFWVNGIPVRENSLLLRNSIYGQAILFTHIVAFILPFYPVVRMKMPKSSSTCRILPTVILATVPFLFALERGNIIIFAFLFSLFFFCGKDAKNRNIREVSFISLAVAVNLKLYPAVFGLFLLYEKRWKDATRCILYGTLIFLVSLVMLPEKNSVFYLTNGVFQFAKLPHTEISDPQIPNIQNTVIESENTIQAIQTEIQPPILATGLNYSLQNSCMLLIQTAGLLGFDAYGLLLLFRKFHISILLTVLLSLGGLFCMIFCKKSWQKQFSATTLMIFPIGRAAGTYILMFLTIPLLTYIEEEEKICHKNLLATFFFIFLFAPIAIPVEIMQGTVYFISIDFLAKLFALISMYIYLLASAIRNLSKQIKKSGRA